MPSANLKPITLHGHTAGPNPWKVLIILEELGVPYDMVFQTMGPGMKSPPYSNINPNGRVPAIEDPNTGITLWESGAIIEYLVDTYDTEHKITHGAVSPEKWLEKQYLFFQVSGQGPYFGQHVWFANYHPERIASATERYLNEIKRVTRVLNTILEGKEYLVGNKVTYADLSFVNWALIGHKGLEADGFDIAKETPNYAAWIGRLLERPAVKKMMASKDKAQAAAAH